MTCLTGSPGSGRAPNTYLLCFTPKLYSGGLLFVFIWEEFC